MDAITAIASCAAIILKMIQDHNNDPKSRLNEILSFQEKLMQMAKEVTDGSNTPEKIDELESLFLNALKSV